MAYKDNISRLSRLTAILLKLQTRPFIAVAELAEEFGVSSRTIYRDLEALEASGVPIVTVEGKGYALIDGYRLPPVMFTESEANALILAEKIIGQTKDASLIQEFKTAIDKIKSILRPVAKERAELLANRIIIGRNWQNERTSDYLTIIQSALTNFRLLYLKYQKEGNHPPTERTIEPFAIYHNPEDHWVLIAWCRLRKEFRNFRVDRMLELRKLEEVFEPHKITLAEYVEIQRIKHFAKKSDGQ